MSVVRRNALRLGLVADAVLVWLAGVIVWLCAVVRWAYWLAARIWGNDWLLMLAALAAMTLVGLILLAVLDCDLRRRQMESAICALGGD